MRCTDPFRWLNSWISRSTAEFEAGVLVKYPVKVLFESANGCIVGSSRTFILRNPMRHLVKVLAISLVLCSAQVMCSAQGDHGPLDKSQHDMIEHLRDALQEHEHNNAADHSHEPLSDSQRGMVVQVRDALANATPVNPAAINNSPIGRDPSGNPGIGQQSAGTTGPSGTLYGIQGGSGQGTALSPQMEAQLTAQLAGLAIMQANDVGHMVMVSNQYGSAIASPYGDNSAIAIQNRSMQVIAQSPVGEQMAAQLAAQAMMNATGTVTNQYGTGVARPVSSPAPTPTPAQTQDAIRLLDNTQNQIQWLRNLPQNAYPPAQVDLNNAAALTQGARIHVVLLQQQLLSAPPPGSYPLLPR
jgi:hypothetical protein